MSDFVMPTPEEIAKMDSTEIENKRVEALKEIQVLRSNKLITRLALNDLSRQEALIKTKKLDLSDKMSRANVAIEDLEVCADRLKTLYFQRK